MEWTREKTLILIEEYKKRRGLWDMTHEDYRKKDIKRELLAEVAEKIDTTAPNIEIEKKFHTLRTQYHREIHRMKKNSNGEYKSKWFAFKHLEFLSSPRACRIGKTDFVKVKLEKSPNTTEKKKVTPTRYVIKEIQHENEPQTTITTEFLTIHKPSNNNNQNRKQRSNESRKDLEKLIEETTKEEDDTITEVADNHNEFKQPVKSLPIHQHYTTTNLQTLEQYFDEGDGHLEETNETSLNATIVHDNGEFHTTQQPAIIRLHKRDISGLEQTNSYEEDTQLQPQPKKVFIENRPPSIGTRDEFAIYGEYVSNELRTITSRDILVTLKHKINTALFEANMAQLHK